MRAVWIDKKHLRRDAQIQQHPAWNQARAGVEEMIQGLRAARRPSDYFELHRDLLSAFFHAQQRQDLDRREREHVRAEIKQLANSGSRKRIREPQQLLTAIDFEIDVLNALLSVFRSVADAIVWHLVGFHRGAVTALSDGQRVGRLSDGIGLETELAELSNLWNERGIVAVHADITNCVRTGDLLSVEQWNPRVLRLTESKHGRAGKRGKRQYERLEQLTQLLNTGVNPTGGVDGGPLEMEICPVAIDTHLPAIERMLQDAKAKGYVATEIEDGMFVEAYDYSNTGRFKSDDLIQRSADALKRRGWEQADTLRQTVEFRRLRDQQSPWGTQLPLALLPFSVTDTCGLVMGPLDYAITVHAPTLERRLSSPPDISVLAARGEDAGAWFLRATRGDKVITVPSPSREQLLLEGFTIDSLRRIVQWTASRTKTAGTQRRWFATGFAADTRLWSTSRA